MSLAVLGHAAATLFLTGMIWTIQVVHYPLFAEVGTQRFVAYEAAHSVRITWTIVGPWIVQGLTVVWLLAVPPAGVPRWIVGVAAVLAAVPVLVTVAASVPAHRTLSQGFDASALRTLLTTNWLRTSAWSLGSVVALGMVWLVSRPA